jgi:hypothetical protein
MRIYAQNLQELVADFVEVRRPGARSNRSTGALPDSIRMWSRWVLLYLPPPTESAVSAAAIIANTGEFVSTTAHN